MSLWLLLICQLTIKEIKIKFPVNVPKLFAHFK